MVDAALYAIREIMEEFPETVCMDRMWEEDLEVYFGKQLLLQNDSAIIVCLILIQEAYIIGSTTGMSAVGVKPIVEIQFADYIYPGFNQLVTELSKSCYLSCGKFPIRQLFVCLLEPVVVDLS
jgi:2-oxoisovalerate dehydrogenase E1 component